VVFSTTEGAVEPAMIGGISSASITVTITD
jgi:hypothetical protein